MTAIYNKKRFFIYERPYPMRSMDIVFMTTGFRIRVNHVHIEPLLYVMFVYNGIDYTMCIPDVNVFKDYVMSAKLKIRRDVIFVN